MRGLRGAAIAMGAAFGAASLAAVTLPGCGDDTAAVAGFDSGADGLTEGGPDGTEMDVISQPDTSQSHDAGTDGDATMPPSEAGTDGPSPGMEAGKEASVEAGAEASVEAGNDASPEAAIPEAGSDAEGDADAGPPYTGLEFANQFAEAYCNAFLGCCEVSKPGVYDTASCIVAVANEGWEQSLPDTNVYSRGHTATDKAKALQCIAALNSFPCGTQTGAQWQAITSACELVVTGTIPVGSAGCVTSFECAANSYCDPTNDGGTCTPLATQGQPCNTVIQSTTPTVPDRMCSYLGSGSPALFCDLIHDAPDAATCQPVLPANAGCENTSTFYFDDMACAAPSLCGDNTECGGTTSYPYGGFCSAYLISTDGG